MKAKFIYLVIMITMLSCTQNIFAQYTREKQDTIIIQDSTKTMFTCPMHPEVISDKPGACSKCSMELVKLEKQKINSSSEPHQMGMMMCHMHGMVDMNHKHNEQKKGKMNMMKGMGIGMGVMMIVMLIIVVSR